MLITVAPDCELVAEVAEQRERRDHVDLEDALPSVGVEFAEGGQRAGTQRAGVVHHEPNGTDGGGRGDESLAMTRVGHVAGHADGARSEIRERFIEAVGASGVDHDGPASIDECGGERPTETLRGTGDDGDGGSGVGIRHRVAPSERARQGFGWSPEMNKLDLVLMPPRCKLNAERVKRYAARV